MEGTVARAVLKSMMEDTGGAFVMMAGTSVMLMLCAGSLDVAWPSAPREILILATAMVLCSLMM